MTRILRFVRLHHSDQDVDALELAGIVRPEEVIVGYVNPDGSGEGNWSAYDGLGALEAWNEDANR